MINMNVKEEAKELVAAYDRGELDWADYERTAGGLADFWIESQFARVDCECDWSDEKCSRMAKRMTKELKSLGLP
jgi:hypothetical protein